MRTNRMLRGKEKSRRSLMYLQKVVGIDSESSNHSLEEQAQTVKKENTLCTFRKIENAEGQSTD